jgi:DnaA regulatory inactivator Hda
MFMLRGMATQQLIFDFTNTPDISAKAYMPLSSHQNVLNQLHFAQNLNGFRGLRISGEKGCGKTHLLKAWSAVVGAEYINDEAAEIPQGQIIAVDDIDKLSPKGQEQLFHIYNAVQKRNGLLVVAGTEEITPQTDILPDLRSRLLTLPSVHVENMTDADLNQLLLKWAEDSQLSLKPDVIKYLLSRAERSPAVLNGLIRTLDELSLTEKRAITLPLVRKVLIK